MPVYARRNASCGVPAAVCVGRMKKDERLTHARELRPGETRASVEKSR
jgi:hypothetical protein